MRAVTIVGERLVVGERRLDEPVADQVVVNGTQADDTIAVVDEGATVAVQGLSAAVRVKGANSLMDQLIVNGLIGNDTITSTPGAAALILLSLVP